MNMSIRTKLLAAFLLNLLLMIGLGTFAIVQVTALKERTAFIGNNVTQALEVIGEMQESLAQYQGFQAEYLADADAEGRQHLEQEISDVEQDMDALFKQAETLTATDEERSLFDHLRTTWPGFVARTQQDLLPASRANDLTGARKVFAELDSTFEDLHTTSNNLP